MINCNKYLAKDFDLHYSIYIKKTYDPMIYDYYVLDNLVIKIFNCEVITETISCLLIKKFITIENQQRNVIRSKAIQEESSDTMIERVRQSITIDFLTKIP